VKGEEASKEEVFFSLSSSISLLYKYLVQIPEIKGVFFQD